MYVNGTIKCRSAPVKLCTSALTGQTATKGRASKRAARIRERPEMSVARVVWRIGSAAIAALAIGGSAALAQKNYDAGATDT
jgi:hypothetical protein